MKQLITIFLTIFLMQQLANAENYGALYYGQPQISIPITSIKTKSVEMPIYLSYDASGNKVNAEAGNFGLGWSLNKVAYISRQVRGIPDDYHHTDADNIGVGWLFDKHVDLDITSSLLGWTILTQDFMEYDIETARLIQSYVPDKHTPWRIWNFLKKFEKHWLDTEPDKFEFVIPGHSGEFYFNEKREIVQTNPTGLLITYDLSAINQIERFTITDLKKQQGLNSKSLFKKTFNKETRRTPTEFKKTHLLSII